MKLIANILYLTIGSIFPILIGALHTWVHFHSLTQPGVRQALSEPIMLMGRQQPPWNTWGVMSFMMGLSFIIIGLLNVVVMQKYTWKSYPPISGILAMLLYLGGVIYVGNTFDALPQYYGGIFGFVLGGICLCIAGLNKSKTVK